MCENCFSCDESVKVKGKNEHREAMEKERNHFFEGTGFAKISNENMSEEMRKYA
jgi:hypothetical protein